MNPTSNTEKINADPFAADIFAAQTARAPDDEASAETETIETTPEIKKQNLWSRRLPRISRSAARLDELWRSLAPDFFGEGLPRRLADALARLLSFPAEKTIDFAFFRRREINRAEDFSLKNCWRLVVGSNSEAAEVILEIDDALAVWLIDSAFGAENSETVIRPLTPTETAVLEFLAINLTHKANRFLLSPQFQFRRLSRQIPDSLLQITTSESFSLLVLEWQTTGALPPTLVRIYLSPESLKSLQADGKRQPVNASRRVMQNLTKQVKNVRARLACGAAELTFGELAALENGDVVLPENHELLARGGNLAGRAEVFLGDGDNRKIIGEIIFSARRRADSFEENAAKADNKIAVRRVDLTASPRFIIKDFAETDAAFDKFMSETDDNLTGEIAENAADGGETAAADDAENGGLTVENLVVALRVELEARRLTLSEIAGLRENQTLELGIKPTDEVNILIDDHVVGRGELVIVGESERLGVRITKLMR